MDRDVKEKTKAAVVAAALLTAVLMGGMAAGTRALEIGLAGVPVVALVVLFLVKPIPAIGLVAVIYATLQPALHDRVLLEFLGTGLNVSKLFVGGVTALMVLRLAVHGASKKRVLEIPKPAVLLLTLAAIVLANALRSPLPGMALASGLRIVASAMVLVYASQFCRERGQLEFLLRVTEIISVIMGVSAAYSWFQDQGIIVRISVGAFRAGGLWGDPVATSLLATVGLPSAFARLARESTRREKVWAAVVVAAVIAAMVTTLTRRAVLLLVAMVLAFLLENKTLSSSTKKVAIALVLGLMGVTVGSMFLTGSAIEARLADIPGVSGSAGAPQDMGSGRGLIWNAVLQDLGDSGPAQWILGHGTETARLAVVRYAHWERDSHNSYLELLYDTGLVGLLCFLLFQYSILRSIKRVKLRKPWVGLPYYVYWYLLAYALVVDFFGNAIYRVDARWFVFLVVGALYGWKAKEA